MSDNLDTGGGSHHTPPTPAQPAASTAPASSWEREVLEKLVFATLKEQKSARRWGIFFKFATLLVIVVALGTYFDFNWTGSEETLGRHTALIEIDGAIESEGSGAASVVIPALNKAFSDAGSVAVVMHINSPGGSPVQAGMIVDEMNRLRKGYPGKPLYVVVDEICASGCYYIAAGADRIYVNKASIIGSIGVLMDGFGFTGAMDKLGVERRLLTAGENKAMLDPFSPLSDKHRAYAQAMLDEIHQQFIKVVREGRGKRLKETPDTFSGLFWSGEDAVKLGLADRYGNLDYVAREVVKAEEVIDYTPKENVAEKLAKRLGASIGDGAVRALRSMAPIR